MQITEPIGYTSSKLPVEPECETTLALMSEKFSLHFCLNTSSESYELIFVIGIMSPPLLALKTIIASYIRFSTSSIHCLHFRRSFLGSPLRKALHRYLNAQPSQYPIFGVMTVSNGHIIEFKASLHVILLFPA